MEKADPEGPKAIEEKLRTLPTSTLCRLRPAPADGSLLTKCTCGTQFGLLIRQHHCRSCGQIFCWACTEKRVILPEILIEYQNKTGWWERDIPVRICKECYDRFIKYEECRPLIEQFYARPHSLERILTLGHSNEITKRAISYYLSDMRRIQYLFPSEGLTSAQIDFLRTNRVVLSSNPGAWLMQILKVESVASQRKILVHNAIDMIIFSKVYRNSLEVALQVLSHASAEELIPYLPVMAAIPDLRLYDILVEKSINSPPLAFLFYWALNVFSDSTNGAETAVSHREHLLVKIGDVGASLINFRRLIGMFDRGLPSMRTSIENHPSQDPLDFNAQIESIDDVKVGDSHSKPVFITYTSVVKPPRVSESYDDSFPSFNNPGSLASSAPVIGTSDVHMRRTASFGGSTMGPRPPIQRKIMFKHEDTRKDACILKIIRMLADNLQDPLISGGSQFPLISYAVLPINHKTGLVEIVEKSATLFSIASTGSINNYIQHHNAQRTIGDVQRTYTLSLAFWTIITYIFGVGDRHFDNIMLSTTGILFHIDYGFIFGNDPKPYSPKIRLNSYMLEGIGGEAKYPEFKETCYRIFISMKKNIERIYTFLLELVMAEPKIEGMEITEPFIRDHLSKVFFVGDSEEGVRAGLEFLIDSSKDSWGASIGEYLHSTAKTTTRFVGRWTGISSSPS